jgi:predicted nucleotidyltransferase
MVFSSMRIDPKEKIAEVPILKVRKLLRYVDNEMEWGENLAAGLLEISPKNVNILLQELERMGYIEPGRVLDRQQLWRKTLKGSTLGLASAAKPVTRKTADRIFSQFMDRVKRANSDPYFLIKVKKVVLFGSYLTNTPRVNDVDVAVELTWKEDHGEVLKKNKAQLALDRAHEAEKKGRTFSTIIDRLSWPEDKVKLYLKSRSRTLSIHSITDQILDQVEHKVVFSDQ